MPVTIERFLENLTSSGLLSEEEIASYGLSLQQENAEDAQQVAKVLIRDGKLTKYQAQLIYEGKQRQLKFAEYVVLDKIGAGGMGVVLRARHERMDREVAIKVLPAETLDDQSAVRRFYQEVKTAAKLFHPNVVTALDAGDHEGMHYLVMEYVDGKDLSELMKANGPLPTEQAVECVLQTAHGLAYAHENGIVHRDIKPGNLLLSKGGTVKILDMGLARFNRSAIGPGEADQEWQLTNSGQMMGTVDYMSPEQAEDARRADHRADIYSLGCTLYRLLCGEPVFGGDTLLKRVLAHRDADIPRIRDRRIDAPETLDTVFQKMLAKSPADRQQSMQEVIKELESSLGNKARQRPMLDEPSSDSALTSFFRNLEEGTAVKSPKETVVKDEYETTPYTGKAEETDSGDSPLQHEQQQSAAKRRTAADRRRLEAKLPILNSLRDNRKLLAAIGGGALLGFVAIIAVLLLLVRPGGDDATNRVSEGGSNGEVAIADTPDRRAAEWVLSIGGVVSIVTPPQNEFKTLNAGDPLPTSPFFVGGVDLKRSDKVDDAGIANLRGLSRLDSLVVTGTRVTDAGVRQLRGLTKLTRLHLESTLITGQCFEIFEDTPRLSFLFLDDTKINNEYLAHLKKLTNPLGELSLPQSISDEGLRHLAEVPVNRLYIPKATDNGLAQLAGSPVGHLLLGSQSITDDGLLHLARLPQLVQVTLPKQIGDDGLKHLAGHPTLTHITAEITSITNEGLRHLAAMKQLKHLVVSSTRVGDDGLAHLANLPKLEYVNLSNTAITDAGLEHLNGLKSLRILKLNNKVTPAAIAALQKALPDCEIK
jgi:serine/threonine protein kinase